MSKNKYISLIKLIDEPNEEIFNSIEKEIVRQKIHILPYLRRASDFYLEQYIQLRIKKIIKTIIVEYIIEELKNWLKHNSDDLLYSLYLMSLYNYPFLELSQIKEKISEIKIAIWLELNEKLTLLEKINVFNRVLYQIYEFKPTSKRSFYDLQNFNLYDVLLNKAGSPVLLCSVYIILAKELNLPIYGVNIPEYFICVAVNDKRNKTVSFLPDGEPLFYINAFSYGTLFTRAQLSAFLEQLQMSNMLIYDNSSCFMPCTNAEIVKRVLQDLQYIYEIIQDTRSLKHIKYIYKQVFET